MSGPPKGVRISGRRKGTPNKDTKELMEIALRLGVSPFEVLLLFVKGDWKSLGYDMEKQIVSSNDHGDIYKYTIEPSVRAKCATEAASYLYPKRKAIELSTDPENPIEITGAITLEDRKEMIKAARESGK